MTITQCIDQYSALSEQVFGKRNSIFSRYLFDSKRLVSAVSAVVQRHLRAPDSEKNAKPSAQHRLFRAEGDGETKVFVVTLAAKNIERPCLLRSYASGPDHPEATCTITEAAWATAAAPSFFKPPKLRVLNLRFSRRGRGLQQSCWTCSRGVDATSRKVLEGGR